MFVRLHRQRDAVLVVEFKEKASNHCEVEYSYYFLWVRSESIEEELKDAPKVREGIGQKLKINKSETNSFAIYTKQNYHEASVVRVNSS